MENLDPKAQAQSKDHHAHQETPNSLPNENLVTHSVIGLIDCLHHLIGQQRQLLEIVREERQALLDSHLKSVEQCSYSKEVLLHSITQSEKQRQAVVEKVLTQINAKTDRPSLNDIIIKIQADRPKEAQQLRSQWNTLKHLNQRIIEQNRENQKLVEAMLEHLNKMKSNVLGGMQEQADGYSNKGAKKTRGPGGKLISGQI